MFTDRVGAVNISECGCRPGFEMNGTCKCPLGYQYTVVQLNGVIVEYKCAPCPKGYYRDGLPSIDPCDRCGLNMITKDINSTSVDECICNVGYYLVDGMCFTCPVCSDGWQSSAIMIRLAPFVMEVSPVRGLTRAISRLIMMTGYTLRVQIQTHVKVTTCVPRVIRVCMISIVV